MSKENWKWSGLKEDLEKFPGDNLIMLPPHGVSDPHFFRVSKARILQLIDDAAKADELAKVQKPKSVVEEIYEYLVPWREWPHHEPISAGVARIEMALAEAVEFIELYRNGYKPGGWDGNVFEAQSSILAILKGEKKRDIPKA
ncbi:hypothetical protein LCGC14_2062090 [marine sediment metagenome]|uniref:Uncharacterized protein n=1 Tax=marine sediment metagenome TaxID=412755 RepID=A0A0F9F890_9ZZZZ